MSVRLLKRVFCCLLLTAGVAVAQHQAVDASADEPCSRLSGAAANCLPEAPSAVRFSHYYRTAWSSHRLAESPQKPVIARKLSPAERPFVALSNRQKFDRFTRAMYSPFTIVNAVYDATWDQADGCDDGYGGGMEGWGNRIGAAAANATSKQFFGKFLFPALLNQDPRYFAMHHGPVWKRLVHAASRTVLTTGDNGQRQVNYSGFLAIASAETLENTWLPAKERSVGKTLNRMVGSLQGAATSYLVREFAPDILRFVRGRSPERVRRLQDRITDRFIHEAPAPEEQSP